jgi:chromosomal replication initiation ATPase DnaA
MADQLSKPAYKKWVKDSILVKKDELSYVVYAPNDVFQYDWLETRYDTLIRECISTNFVNNSDSFINLSYQLIE